MPTFYISARLLRSAWWKKPFRNFMIQVAETYFFIYRVPKNSGLSRWKLRDLASTSINLRIPDLLLPLLKLTPNLTELNIDSCCLRSELEDVSVLYPDYSIKLPKLEALCMLCIDEDESSLSYMFRALDMPNLRSLEFHGALDCEFSDHAINWETICHRSAIETIVLQNAPQAGMKNLLEHIEN
ncbi:hypothetical protein RhiLY_09885 [Ceratobasidium sp. AG-Ba]|nr:hypothetical protein RhiLY_09885 [Ceratobasidium sp. AG-Ba]